MLCGLWHAPAETGTHKTLVQVATSRGLPGAAVGLGVRLLQLRRGWAVLAPPDTNLRSGDVPVIDVGAATVQQPGGEGGGGGCSGARDGLKRAPCRAQDPVHSCDVEPLPDA